MARAFGLALVLALTLAASPAATPDFSGWYTGADGMIEAIQARQSEDQPLFLYFYTDWCPYCRQFERELLSSSEVDDYLDGILAVRVNPEAGGMERQIAQRYGVRGYPALFMHSSKSNVVTQVNRHEVVNGRPKLVNGKPRLMTPGVFVESLRAFAEREDPRTAKSSP